MSRLRVCKCAASTIRNLKGGYSPFTGERRQRRNLYPAIKTAIILAYVAGNYILAAFLNTVVSGKNMADTVTIVHTVCGASAKKDE